VSELPQSNSPANYLVTVIIPTYNSELLLEKCVESVQAQTFRDFEILFVDGASSDRTPSLIRELANTYQNIQWISEKDQGVYDAMNKGVSRARGRWLLFLGADDTLHSSTVLERVAPHLSETVDFVYGNVVLANNAQGQEGRIYDGEFSPLDLASRNICHQAIFYSRRIFSDFAGYNLRFKVFADWDLNLRVFGKVRKKYIDVTIANFCDGGMSSSHADPEFHLYFAEIIGRELALGPTSAGYRDQARGLRRLIGHYVLRGKFWTASKYFRIWLRNERFWSRLSERPHPVRVKAQFSYGKKP
jgi:glycosyltransferase involved in cell wall biosynthesis